MSSAATVAAAVAVAAGVVGGSAARGHALEITAATLLALACAAAAYPRARATLACGLAALALGGAADAAWRAEAEAVRLLPALAEQDAVVRLCGTVTATRPRSVAVDARRVRVAERVWEVRESVRLTAPRRPLRAGSYVCASGSVVPSRHGRDDAPLVVADEVRVVGTGSAVRTAAASVRDAYSSAAKAVLPPQQAGLLLGMTDGDTALLDESTLDDFRTTGLAHLVAVSGSNVAVVLAAVMLAVRFLVPRGRWLRVLVAVPPLVFFAFLTALEASVLRAVVTAGVVLAVTASGRPADGIRVAAAAFVLLVLASPDLLGHPGFQLSFAATVGLLLWAAPLSRRLVAWWPGRQSRAVEVGAAAVATTLAAQVAVAPLLAWHFGQIPVLGGLANLLVAPLAPVVMVGGMATLTAASSWSALEWAPATLRLLLDAILWTGSTFADLPVASVRVGVPSGLALTAALAAVSTPAGRLRVGAAVACAGCVATAAGAALAVPPSWCPGAEIRALDVGQGTAVLLRADGRTVLVDGGPSEGGVVEELEEARVDRIDVAVASHPHADHVAGLEHVVERFDVGLLVGPVTMRWGVGGRLVAAAARHGTRVVEAAAGDSFVLGGGLRVDVVSPDPGRPTERTDDTVNDYSLVLRADVHGVTVILPGDLGARGQAILASPMLAAPVLVAPHHGSADVDDAFVEAVGPGVTLVTVGGENRYGHPTAKALALFARHGLVARTDEHGTVAVCVSDGAWAVVVERPDGATATGADARVEEDE